MQPAANSESGRTKTLTLWTDKDNYPESKVSYSGWNAYSRIDVVENGGAVSWLYNPRFPQLTLPNTQIIIDGDAATSILEDTGDQRDKDFLSVVPSSVPYELLKPRRALVIGSGGGVDVHAALMHGASQVEAVEINPLIVSLMTNRYAEYSGHLFSRSGVNLHIQEGRSFIRHSLEPFDIIQLSLIDTWAALSSGAYSLSENYLYTVEAFRDYFRHLSPNGVLSITRWLWDPPRETLRLCSVGVEALQQERVASPETHFVVFTMGRVATVLLKQTPFSRTEVEDIESLCSERGFELLYDPFSQRENTFHQFFSASDLPAFFQSYSFDITPVTDNNPFFFLQYRWNDLNVWKLLRGSSLLSVPGKLLLLIIFGITFIISACLLLAPLVVKERSGIQSKRSVPFLLYFFFIGVGFMLLEILLMQKFSLFLGHPVYALSVVLFTLLVSSGTGSLCSLRIVGDSKWTLALSLIALALCAFLSFIAFPSLFSVFLSWSFPVRVAVSLVAIFPLAFLMGIAFPSGIHWANKSNPRLLPWAWGVNGFASVITSSLCIILAVRFGFTTVSAMAGLCYVVAALALPAMGKGLPLVQKTED